MVLRLLKYGIGRTYPVTGDIPTTPALRPSYDVVIIGAGGHGLACAHYLSKYHGIRNVAVLDKGWLAGGNTARNTTTIRSSYITPQGIAFYKEGVALYEAMSEELEFNVMFSQRGQLTLAHSEAALRSFHLRAETGRHMGIGIEVVDRKGVEALCPHFDMDFGGALEVLGGLWHPDGGTARHDAVAWGYAAHAGWKAAPGPTGYSSWRDEAWAWLHLDGRALEHALARFCAVDLRPGRFAPEAIAQTRFAHVDAVVVRLGGAAEVFFDIAASAVLLRTIHHGGGHP